MGLAGCEGGGGGWCDEVEEEEEVEEVEGEEEEEEEEGRLEEVTATAVRGFEGGALILAVSF